MHVYLKNMNRIILALRTLTSTRFLARRLERKFIIENTKGSSILPFEVVVDVGRGKAPYKKYINYKKYIGVDIENRGVEVSDLIIADVNKGIPVSDNVADLVMCTETLEHIKQPHSVVRELFRITKPGGGCSARHANGLASP